MNKIFFIIILVLIIFVGANIGYSNEFDFQKYNTTKSLAYAGASLFYSGVGLEVTGVTMAIIGTTVDLGVSLGGLSFVVLGFLLDAVGSGISAYSYSELSKLGIIDNDFSYKQWLFYGLSWLSNAGVIVSSVTFLFSVTCGTTAGTIISMIFLTSLAITTLTLRGITATIPLLSIKF